MNLVHLLQVLLRCWVKLRVEPLLCLLWPPLALRGVVDLEAGAHSRVHHNFTRGLHLHGAVELYLVQVGGGIEVSFLVSGYLLEEVVASRFTLLLL